MSRALIVAAAAALAALSMPVQAQTELTVPVNGMIADNAAAQGGACQKICSAVSWNGQWVTTVQGKMSMCGTAYGNLEAGPIWNQADAQKKCPVITKTTFNGSWTNTPPAGTPYAGKNTAVCGCKGGKAFEK